MKYMNTVRKLIDQFEPTHYDLSLNLERVERRFFGTVTIHGVAKQTGPIRLHSKDLTINSVTVDGHAASFSHHENDELMIESDALTDNDHVLVVGFSGIINDQMHGLYPSYYQHNGLKKELLATQFESHHAREVFPCIDEPAAKATFDVTLTTEKDVTVLGNMPVVYQNIEDDRLVTNFETTPRMSSYLLAWVIGEMHKKSTTTEGGVEVNVWATPAQSLGSLDFALDIATRSIDFFDEYFGVPYPLPKCDHVALPDFSSGAMENWGLITYREVALLADPATTSVSSKHYIATVITHELSHQWFGNLVTMNWWNNLWLNESFATLMEYIAVDALHPEWNVWLDFASSETVMALRRDSTPGVQSVQVEVSHPDEISTLFDGAIVYAKGARLLRMLEQFVGPEAFKAGLRQYFGAHAYGNTTEHDLWDALTATSGHDIAQLMTAWISQSGYPVVNVTANGLTQQQFFIGAHQPSNQLWPIPLGSNDDSLPKIMDQAELTAKLPVTVRLNTASSAHFITNYASEMLDSLVSDIKNGGESATVRLQLLNEQILLARSGQVSSATLVSLVDAYRNETAESVWGLLAATIGELKKFVEADEAGEAALRALAGNLAEAQYQRLGWQPTEAETETDTKLRATIIGLMLYSRNSSALAEAERLYRANPIASLDPELRGLIIGSVVRWDETSDAFTSLLNQYRTSQSAELQMDICAGLTSAVKLTEIKTLLEALTDSDTIRSQDTARWFVYLIRNRFAREATWQWLEQNWAWVKQTYGGDKSYDDFPRYAASGLVTEAQLEAYKTMFVPMQQEVALSRVISMGILEIEARVELINRDRTAVINALSQ